jgi:diguanylate cyclase (GGDEF)-like protein/PAS domain S-box-containing protein
VTWRSPLARISFGLVFLTLSIMLTGDVFFNVTEKETAPILQARRNICEALAVQFSALVVKKDIQTIHATLQRVVRRDSDILSAGLRSIDGKLLAESGVHDRYWKDVPRDKSTPTHAQVPIFDKDTRWGTVEVRFKPLPSQGIGQMWSSPFVRLVLFVAVAGFIGYLVFMKRTLKHLDPAAVIPVRVKAAMDVLADGVVLVNENTEIVLANAAFGEKTGKQESQLLGKNLSKMNWMLPKSNELATDLPWDHAMRDGQDHVEVALCLNTSAEGTRTFMVNGSPILDDKGNPQGALATFDDVTELEEKNEQLREMVVELKDSRDEVGRQNEKLHILATRDPLTNCLNRRAFFEHCEAEFEIAKRDGKPLSCIMTDIDNFKSVNDTYGHGVGDQVIQSVANILRSGLRSIDFIGRYGGEEFCLLMPGVDIKQAAEIADRIRAGLEAQITPGNAALKHTVTSSFGVSSSDFGAPDPSKLIDQADKALYVSKESGRNRVSRWDKIDEKEVA